MTGKFIVLEGGDAVGKSTQGKEIAARLRDRGYEVVETFEPGATNFGARLRELLMGDVPMSPLAEALLMAADRADHVATVIKPALTRGAWVVSDRFLPSSLVYQGVGRALGLETVSEINKSAVDGLVPDLVVVLDLESQDARGRRDLDSDRFETAGDEFAAQVVDAYRDLAPSMGWKIVDASGSPEEVSSSLWGLVVESLSP